MAGYNIDDLMSIKDAYMGNKLQWVKNKDKSKLGKMVELVDVVPGPCPIIDGQPQQRYIAVLNDGTKIDTEALGQHLMMIMDDQPPMTMTQIMSLQTPGEIDYDQIVSNLPETLKETSSLKEVAAAKATQGAPGHDDSNFVPGVNTPLSKISTVQTQPQQPQRTAAPPPKTEDLFGMFTLSETKLNLGVVVKLPTKNLLRMMYSNSQDKDKFVSQLSAYINNSITEESIRASVQKLVGQDKNNEQNESAESA